MPTSQFSTLSFYREPTWHNCALLRSRAVPAQLRSWLLNQGSLTQRLIVASDQRFKVQIIKQRWELPRLSERLQLGLAAKQLALVREVILFGRDEPWVYARSVLPMNSLSGRLRRLRKLDNQPLGALLFKDKTMQRSPIEVACLTSNNCILPNELKHLAGPIWGRRSVFRLDNKPLLVSEIFLPDSPAYKITDNYLIR